MAMKTKPTKTPAAAAGASAKATSTKKRRRDAPTVVAADAVAVAAAAPIHVSAKKQRLEQVSAIAKDVMLELLRGELSYTVRDDEWEKLVSLTQQHPNFAKHFAFPAASEPGWVTPKKKTKPTHLKILALDCEMCVTAPLARAADRKSNALCRVSAVDGEDMIRGIVSDLIVHQPEPGYRLIDAKTDIHGITVAMIDQSKISVEKAQKFLLKYINADTILVGHSLHGDLASLRINHTRVIDTAKIFQRKQGDAARATPGLKCLTKFLLRFEMPDGHDSTIDAQASMLAAKYAARHKCGAIIPSALELHGPRTAGESRRGAASETYAGPPKIVPSGFQLNITTPEVTTVVPAVSATATRVPMSRPPPQEVMAARSCQLRVHHIPRGITAPDLEHFFVQTAKVVPAAVETPLWKDKQRHGAANVTFASALHAQLAFDALAGGGKKEALDAIGRPQKLVTVTTTKGKKYKGLKVGVM